MHFLAIFHCYVDSNAIGSTQECTSYVCTTYKKALLVKAPYNFLEAQYCASHARLSTLQFSYHTIRCITKGMVRESKGLSRFLVLV